MIRVIENIKDKVVSVGKPDGELTPIARHEDFIGEICQRCGAERVFCFIGKANDCFVGRYKSKELSQGYAPNVANVCGGDYIESKICLECGQTQGKFPVDDSEILERLKIMINKCVKCGEEIISLNNLHEIDDGEYIHITCINFH